VTSSGFGVLTADTESPVVAESSVVTDFLQTFQVVTELGVQGVGEKLVILPGLKILLSVQEPFGDLELKWVLDDGDQLFDLIISELPCSFVAVNFSHLAAHIGETATDTLDGAQRELGLDTSIDVGVQHTQNVLEIGGHDERLRQKKEKENVELSL